MSTARLRDAYEARLGVTLPHAAPERIRLLCCERCDLRFFTPPFLGGEEFYDALYAAPDYSPAHRAEFEIAQRYIGADADVLEIGAGSGGMARRLSCGSYTGLELSQGAIDVALRDGVQLRKELVEEHAAVHPGRYDVVCAFQVLEHVGSVHSFLDAAMRCLRRSGRLIVAVPSHDSFLAHEADNPLNLPPHHATRWSDLCLRRVSDVLPLDLVALEHEPLADEHLAAYVRTVAYAALRSFVTYERPLLASRAARTAGVPVRALARLLARGLRDVRLRPHGHSVIAVYERREP